MWPTGSPSLNSTKIQIKLGHNGGFKIGTMFTVLNPGKLFVNVIKDWIGISLKTSRSMLGKKSFPFIDYHLQIGSALKNGCCHRKPQDASNKYVMVGHPGAFDYKRSVHTFM